MRRTSLKRGSRRSGKIVVMVAVMLPAVIVPFLALGVDGGLMMNKRRELQSAADAAALTAAIELYYANPHQRGNSVHPVNTSAAYEAALGTLQLEGFTEANCEIRTVSIPADSSNARIDGKPGTVEVVVTYLQPRGFSRILGSDDLRVAARAVARVRSFSQGNGIIILEESDNRSLYGRGGGTLIVNDGGVAVNSTGASAATTDGSTTVLAGTSFDVTGGYAGDRYFNTPYPGGGPNTPYTGSVPVSDPLRNLPEPNPADYTLRTAPPNAGPPGTTITLQPGRYASRLFYDGQRTIVLSPGFYYLERGIGLQGDVQLTGEGVTIYNAGSGADNINLGGQGEWTLSPATSGPYAGISIYQSRYTASEDTTMILRGNGGAGVSGTIYAPTTRVRLTGNGTQVLASQFISRKLELDGQGRFTVDYAAARAPQPPIIELVE